MTLVSKTRFYVALSLSVLLVPAIALGQDSQSAQSGPPSGKSALPADHAQPAHPEQAHGGSLAKAATDPSAILTQFQFQLQSGKNRDSSEDLICGVTNCQSIVGSTWIFQPVLPVNKRNVLRATLPIISENSRIDGATGIGDLFVFDLWLFNQPHGTFGFGPAASFPTASDDELGTGKFSLGPAFLYMFKGFKKTILGVLAFNTTSVAGDGARADVNSFGMQIVWTTHTKWGYVGWTDLQPTIDWENDKTSFPVGIRFGKVYGIGKAKNPINVFIEPYYMFNSSGVDNSGIKLNFTMILPQHRWRKKK